MTLLLCPRILYYIVAFFPVTGSYYILHHVTLLLTLVHSRTEKLTGADFFKNKNEKVSSSQLQSAGADFSPRYSLRPIHSLPHGNSCAGISFFLFSYGVDSFFPLSLWPMAFRTAFFARSFFFFSGSDFFPFYSLRPMAFCTALLARSFGARVRAESKLWILLPWGEIGRAHV